MQLTLSVVIPAYNEEKAIGSVLDRVISILSASNKEYEIIVVDDGSMDNTAEVVKKQGSVNLLHHSVNKGYGSALKTGIRHAKGGIICITDADGTYPNEDIPMLTKVLIENDLDMVVGARTGDNVIIPTIRKPAKWALGKLANIVVGEHIPDLNSGLRVFKRSAVFPFFNLLPDGFSFTTTITLGMLTNGYLVDYMPINYNKRIGKSKIRPVHDTMNFIQLIMRIALYFNPLKIFLPISSVCFLIAFIWGVFSRFVLGDLADVSTLVIAMTGVQVAVIGLLAELIDRRLPNYYREEE